MFVDALIDLQTWVECLQQNNTTTFPHCATFYNCGLTIIDAAPRGIIKRLSVIDKAHALPSGEITASKSNNVVTASADIFDASMTGSLIQFADGQTFKIIQVLDSRNLQVHDVETGDDSLVIDAGVP